MTPFGERVRQLREARGIALKDMARDLHISSAYLSALEHGHKGLPSPILVQQICAYFGIIWDEAEELERLVGLSDPRVTVDTAGLSPRHTLVANLLARRIGSLGPADLDRIVAVLDGQPAQTGGPGGP